MDTDCCHCGLNMFESGVKLCQLHKSAADLLEAAKFVVEYARNSRTGRMLSGEGFAMLEAAIAKATGN